MKRDNITLKSYFETGDYPTEAQFIDLIDSFLNIEENDALTGITDNGDGTYTFQLLSGPVTIDVQNLPNDIPIASIAGLQVILDNIPNLYLRKDQNGVISGALQMASNSGIRGTSTGTANVGYFSFFENNGTTRQGYIGFGSPSNSDLLLSNDVASSYLRLGQNGGVNDLVYYQGGGSKTVWHSGNDGSGSGLDADLLDGINSSGFVRKGLDQSGAINGGYLIFNYDNATSVDAISFNDTNNGYYFNADVAKSITTANANVHANDFYANGTAYFGDGKEIIRYSDSWLRLNPTNSFTNGIYCGTTVLRTDGQFEVGASGANFKVKSTGELNILTNKFVVLTNGTVTAAGNITANSDVTLKHDIHPMEENILEKILKLIPSTYKWKDREMDQNPQMGFIAQEVREQFPEWVHQGEEHLSLCYDKMAAVLAVKGIQELYEEIKKLKEEIKKLKYALTE